MALRLAPEMRAEPALGSVDRALRMIQLLRDFAPLRLVDASEELGVSPSTAHRLLSALAYRGYAVQGSDRLYRPGPALGEAPIVSENAAAVRDLVRPHLARLVADTGETAHFMVRVGGNVRILDTRAGWREGALGDGNGLVLPAVSTAAGRALLAALPPAARTAAIGFDVAEQAERAGLREELAAVVRRGFAVGTHPGHPGVRSLAVAIEVADNALAAVSVTIPDARFRDALEAGLAKRMLQLRSRFHAERHASQKPVSEHDLIA